MPCCVYVSSAGYEFVQFPESFDRLVWPAFTLLSDLAAVTAGLGKVDKAAFPVGAQAEVSPALCRVNILVARACWYSLVQSSASACRPGSPHPSEALLTCPHFLDVSIVQWEPHWRRVGRRWLGFGWGDLPALSFRPPETT
jgi:hypothetical protein